MSSNNQTDRFSSLTFNFNGTKINQTEKCCVLAVDVSGSVGNSKLYWDKVNKILNEILAKSYSNYKIVAWDSSYEDVSVQTLRSFIQNQLGRGGTEAYVIWDYLHQQKLTNYDLYLTTDGQIGDNCYDRYIRQYNGLQIKPDNVTVYYIGMLSAMNMKFLDCFKRVVYVIHGTDESGKMVSYTSRKYPKDFIFNQLIEIEEFKRIEQKTVQNLPDALEKLYKTLHRKVSEYSENELNGEIGIEFKRFVDHLNTIVHQNYIDDEEFKDNGAAFDELFDDYKSNSKQIFAQFVKRFKEARSNDFRKVLDEIIELCNGRSKVDRGLVAYGKNLYDQSEPSESDYEAEPDDEDDILTELNNAAEFNLNRQIHMLHSSEYSKFCVVWIGIDEVFGGDRFQQMFDMETQHEVEKNAMQLFEILKPENLNRKLPITNHHISLGSFAGLQSFELNTIGEKRFKHIYMAPSHQACCFGIVLYNADDKTVWPPKMTENEKTVYFHNYATLTHLLFGESKFLGSLSLLHTFFLQILIKCNRIDPFIESCIMKTIQRSTTILKCRFMMQAGLEPNFYTLVKNAIIFHTDIYPKEIDTLTTHVPGIDKLNIPRRNVQCCSDLLSLGKDAFGVIYSEEYGTKLKLFQFWNYMMCESEMTNDEKLLHFKQIALTKILNWVPIDNEHIKIMFIEGKRKKPYLDYLDDIEFNEIVKLIILFEKDATKTLHSNICTKNIVLATSGQQWYHIRPIEKIERKSCNLFNLEFCKAICDFPIICPYTKKLRSECCGTTDFYVEKCRSLILIKSQTSRRMQIPNTDELKKYIVSVAPLSIYHADIDRHLEMVIEKHRAWYDWYENGSANERSKYLWIGSNWNVILQYRNLNLEFLKEQLKMCDCEAHSIRNATFLFKLAVSIIIVMFVFCLRHAIIVAIMIAFCIWMSRNI